MPVIIWSFNWTELLIFMRNILACCQNFRNSEVFLIIFVSMTSNPFNGAEIMSFNWEFTLVFFLQKRIHLIAKLSKTFHSAYLPLINRPSAAQTPAAKLSAQRRLICYYFNPLFSQRLQQHDPVLLQQAKRLQNAQHWFFFFLYISLFSPRKAVSTFALGEG